MPQVPELLTPSDQALEMPVSEEWEKTRWAKRSGKRARQRALRIAKRAALAKEVEPFESATQSVEQGEAHGADNHPASVLAEMAEPLERAAQGAKQGEAPGAVDQPALL